MFTLTTKLYFKPAQVYAPIPDQVWLDRQREGLAALFGWRLGAPEVSETDIELGPIYCAVTGRAIGTWSVRPYSPDELAARRSPYLPPEAWAGI